MEPSSLSDGELKVLELAYEERDSPPELPWASRFHCFNCYLEALRDPLPMGSMRYEAIPWELWGDIDRLIEKGLARPVVFSWPGLNSDRRGVLLTDAGKLTCQRWLQQKEQARHVERLAGGSQVNIYNIRNSHGFIAGSQRDFSQDNSGWNGEE
ncbi:hypothetical protein [Streptomyces sp. NBC_01285]|uniref:hypothetical protein n=1 Tax=Streptomyces sp. NBC_01285 TaxID=2903813 RepID=UPI00224D3E55|nr:hypothetical protein [Streptomyces sp. NBC_01285]MCX4773780.1 hypothetical protein [Streptomyces sp. NBC_01285]